MRILLLEDNSTDVDLIRNVLIGEYKDCIVVLSSTIKEAIEVLGKESNFDLAVLDLNLPDGNGLDVLLFIKKRKFDFPSIVLTGDGNEDTAVSALKAGASDYLIKRIGFVEQLPRVIDNTIQQYHTAKIEISEIVDVLYIEHHQIDIDLTKRHFKKYAPYINISTVHEANGAIKILKKTTESNSFSVILMDYNLTGTNALELIKIIRQELNIPIPIILVTGQGSEEIAVQALKLGANEYLTKTTNYLYRLPSLIMSSYHHAKLSREQILLAESEKKYRLLAENSGDVIFVLDLDLKYKYISPAVKSLRGYSPEEAMKQNFAEIMTEKSYDSFDILFSRLADRIDGRDFTDYSELIELELIRKDKTTVWAEVRLSIITENNDPVGILGVSRNITLRKEALLELRKLSLAVEQSPNAIVITDIDGHIEYVNPKFSVLTGYSVSESIGRNPRLLKSGHTKSEEYIELWDTIKKGKEWQGEFLNKKKDGELYWEHASISPVRDSVGEITHYIAIKEDITENKRVIAELREAKEKAEESDRLKSAFLASMSHEIRTPLNAIVGFSGIIADSNNDKELKEMSETIYKQNELLLRLVNDIIDFAKVESGSLEIQHEEFYINDIIDDLRVLYEAQTQENIDLFPVVSENKQTIFSDRNRIKQVFINLINNSIKFTSKGEISYGYVLDGTVITCFVKDTGEGIPLDKQEYIFERFAKLDSFSQGTGLGLAISKRIILLLGGKIWVDSEVNRGSTFYFTIPIDSRSVI